MNTNTRLPWLVCLLAALAIGQPAISSAAWQDASAELSVTQSPRALDRTARVLFSYITVKNTGSSEVPGPFRVVIPSTNIPLLNPDGQTTGGEDFLLLSSQTSLNPGESTVLRANFALQRARLSFTTRPERDVAQSQPTPAHVGGPQSVLEGHQFTLSSLSGNAPGPLSYLWQQTGGPLATLPPSLTTASITAVAPTGLTNAAIMSFQLTVTDGNGAQSVTTTRITLNPDQIFIDAGQDRSVFPGDLVTLHALGNGNGGSSIYTWTQISPASPQPPLTDGATANPEFTAPIPTINNIDLVYEVSFSDGIKTATDRVTVEVQTPVPTALPGSGLTLIGTLPALPLVVVAPPPSHVVGTGNQQLIALATGGDGAYSWSWTYLGSTPSVTDPSTGPTTGPVLALNVVTPALYEYQIEVTDGNGAVSTATTSLSMATTPTATAPLQVIAPSLVSHEGTPDIPVSALAIGGTGPYSYSWAQTAGPSVTLQHPDQAIAYFPAPAVIGNTTLSFRVIATDSLGATVQRNMNVVVLDTFATTPQQQVQLQPLPTPDVLGGQTIQMAVGATGGDGNYSWSWTQTQGSAATISGAATDTLSVTPQTVVETLEFEVTVTDGNAQSATETVAVNVLASGPPQPLTLVNIPNMHVDEGRVGTALAAVASGGTGNYSFFWVFHPSSTVPSLDIELGSIATSVLRFKAPLVDAKTPLAFTVTVNDGQSSKSENVTVLVNDITPPLLLKLAQPHPPLRVHSSDLVALSGPQAFGGKGPYVYNWSQSSGPAVSLTDGNTTNPRFTAPAVTGTTPLVFQMTATDSLGNVISATESVVVKPVVLPLKAELTGPDAVKSGDTLSFSAKASGGSGNYGYSYTTSGVQLTLDSTDNPSITAPDVSQSTTVKVTLTVHDDSSPPKTVQATKQVVIAPATAARTTAYNCGSQENNVPCTPLEGVTGGTVVQCPPEKPFGMNTIQIQNGVVSGIRSCGSDNTCRKKWYQETSDINVCTGINTAVYIDPFTVQSCTFCCLGKPGDPPCNGPTTWLPANPWIPGGDN